MSLAKRASRPLLLDVGVDQARYPGRSGRKPHAAELFLILFGFIQIYRKCKNVA
jgi:hypothetical protein